MSEMTHLVDKVGLGEAHVRVGSNFLSHAVQPLLKAIAVTNGTQVGLMGVSHSGDYEGGSAFRWKMHDTQRCNHVLVDMPDGEKVVSLAWSRAWREPGNAGGSGSTRSSSPSVAVDQAHETQTRRKWFSFIAVLSRTNTACVLRLYRILSQVGDTFSERAHSLLQRTEFPGRSYMHLAWNHSETVVLSCWGALEHLVLNLSNPPQGENTHSFSVGTELLVGSSHVATHDKTFTIQGGRMLACSWVSYEDKEDRDSIKLLVSHPGEVSLYSWHKESVETGDSPPTSNTTIDWRVPSVQQMLVRTDPLRSLHLVDASLGLWIGTSDVRIVLSTEQELEVPTANVTSSLSQSPTTPAVPSSLLLSSESTTGPSLIQSIERDDVEIDESESIISFSAQPHGSLMDSLFNISEPTSSFASSLNVVGTNRSGRPSSSPPKVNVFHVS